MESRSKGALFMLAAACFFALTAAVVKSLTGIPVAEKVFFRNIISLVPIIVLAYKKQGSKRYLAGNNKLFLILRGILGLIATGGYYYALSNAPLADTVTLTNIYPFFVIIFSWFFIKEKIKKVHIYTFLLSLMGAVMIIRPQFDSINLFYIFAFFSAVFTGGAYTAVKYLQKTDETLVIMFYYSLITAIAFLPLVLMGHFVIPKGWGLIKLLMLGVTGTMYQICMTTAYKYAPAGEIAIYSYASIVFSGIIGLLLWNEIPTLLSLAGSVFIITAAFINYKARQTKTNEPI